MPSNRGAHPEDAEQFGPEQHDRLRAAVRDLSWLRTQGYSGPAVRKLVGDRYRLKRRQRNAVARSACSDAERNHRLRARLSPAEVAQTTVHVDAFNALITVEAALGGAYLFLGRDTGYRDVNPLQGTYRVVRETTPALKLLATTLHSLAPAGVIWHLDRSISNVGRVKERLGEVLSEMNLAGQLVDGDDVDAALHTASGPVVTSDSAILDESDAWLHLEALAHGRHIPDAHVVDLRPDGERSSWPPGVDADHDFPTDS